MPETPQANRNSLPKWAGFALLFAALTAGLCLLLNFVLDDDIHVYSRVMLEEMYGQAGEIDTIFLGSSHCYRSFMPDLVSEELGVHAFNAGTSQQQLDGSYWLLREALEENPIQTVYLETFYTILNSDGEASNPKVSFLLIDYLRPTSLNRYRYLLEMGGAAALPDLILPARHNIVTPGEIPALLRAKLTDGYEPGNYAYLTYPGEEEYRGNGFVYTYGTAAEETFESILAVDPAAPVSDFARENLDRIAALCAEYGARLVLVNAPLPTAYLANTENYQSFVDTMRAYAAEHDSEFWDFSLYRDADVLPLGRETFSDAHHLNGEGAALFTGVFCDVAARSAAGEDVRGLFFDTVAEKIALAPDGTFLGDPAAAEG